MRNAALQATLEAIARRGPWGTPIRTQTADGKTVIQRISKSWFRRQLQATEFEPQPRADKGARYVMDPPKVRTRDADGKPLTFSGQTRRILA